MTDLPYLSRFPEKYRYLGDSVSGEIAITTGAKQDGETGIVFEDDRILIVRDAVEFPDGHRGTYLRLFETQTLTGETGIVIVPTFEGQFVLVRVFRHAVREWSIELPRGYRDEGESPMIAAKRELMEEVGVRPKWIQQIGAVQPNSAILASEIIVVAAEIEVLPNISRPVASEAIGGVVIMTESSLVEAIGAGNIKDSISIAAFGIHIAARTAACTSD